MSSDVEDEMQCYKKVIPFSLPCKTQLEYLDCLGASAAARVQYLQYAKLMQEADSYRKRMPTDWTCQQQMDYLDCMGVGEEVKRVLACSDGTQPQAPAKNNGNNPASFSASSFSVQQNNPSSFSTPSFSTPSFSAPTSFSADQNQDISEMIQQCKSEFRSSGLNVPRPPSSCKNADNARQSLTESPRRNSSPRGFDEDSSVYSANKNFTEEFASFDRKSSDVIGRERASSGERRNSGQERCADVTTAKKSADLSDGRKSSSFGNNYSTQFEQSVTKPMASFASAGSFVQEDDEDAPDTESDLNHPMFGKQTEAPEPTLLEEMQMYKTHLANIRRRYFGALCKEMENAEVITPDIAAAMVYSGELGISMKAAPEKVYDFLYPDAPGNQTINIANVMANLPKGLDDIVVPIVPPITLESRNIPIWKIRPCSTHPE
ncbi:hypothetical protein LSTR_LSTR006964 [Laodelphax striatellus]|uniref:Uncharacterized protein n=1 Tax=Laodelphax striatellus TaxID=195883 RepID=A0A482WQW2_LAOST|nr:hypothetical protein LSTR_LSTR006964 [Laodelphax striatellus]